MSNSNSDEEEFAMVIEYEPDDEYDPRILENSPRFSHIHPNFPKERVRQLLIRANALRRARGGSEITSDDVLSAIQLCRIVILNGKEPDQ